MAEDLPQELASLVDTETLFVQPKIDTTDDYCRTVFDMTAWVDPVEA